MQQIKSAVVVAIAVGLVAVVLAGPAAGRGARPSPARVGYLAFWKDDTDELWACRLDGTGHRPLSAPGESVTTSVGFSSRSELLAWWSEIDGKPGYQLRVSPVTGGAPRTIFTDTLASYADADAPAFTPDGRFIIFGRSTEENGAMDWGLWEVGVAGGHLRQLTKGFRQGLGSHMASVSPDGKLIAFYWQRGGADCELCLVRRAGGTVVQTGLMVSDLTWSPKGSVVISQFGRGESWYRSIRLVVYDPRTKRITPLTRHATPPRADTGPSFAPGGREMAYFSSLNRGYAHGSDSVMLMDIATKRTTVLARHVEDPSAPQDPLELAPQPTAWALDGSRVFFAAKNRGNPASIDIWSIRPDGGDRQKVVQHATLAGVFEK